MAMIRADFSLRRLAAIKISRGLWEDSALTTHLKRCIDILEPPQQELPYLIADSVNQYSLPQPLRQELTFVIGMMGHELLSFNSKLHQVYYGNARVKAAESIFHPEPSIWINHVTWTNYGCIDYAKTMESLYKINYLPRNVCTWLEICLLCLEDCIDDCRPKIPQDLYLALNFTPRRQSSPDFISDLLLSTYWATRNEPAVVEMMQALFLSVAPGFYDDTYQLEENMFIYSFITRQNFAQQHFWKSMNKDQRKRTIGNICDRITSDEPSAESTTRLFFSKHTINTPSLVFFLQQLCIYDHDEIRIKILGSGFVLRELLHWSYYNSFMDTLEEMWVHHESMDYKPVISELCKMICRATQDNYVLQDVHWRRIFQGIWNANPKNLKESIDFGDILKMMWKQQELALLTQILNDGELVGRRQEFLSILVEAYEPDETSNGFYETFVRRFFESDEERTAFRDQVRAKHGADSSNV